MDRVLSDEQGEEILRMYNNGEGLPPLKISERTGIPYRRVYNCILNKTIIAQREELSKYLAEKGINPRP